MCVWGGGGEGRCCTIAPELNFADQIKFYGLVILCGHYQVEFFQ